LLPLLLAPVLLLFRWQRSASSSACKNEWQNMGERSSSAKPALSTLSPYFFLNKTWLAIKHKNNPQKIFCTRKRGNFKILIKIHTG
jgi:hypothetical protein